ncbi:MAG: hypothetical protein SF339_22675 [Blastocatellia bacterium]|nr:hypothetical protein [Blastocatellia bacterium]
MLIRKFVKFGVFIILAAQGSGLLLGQELRASSNDKISMDGDVQKIASQIASCPAWDRIESENVAVRKKIEKCLEAISRNDIVLIRQAIALLFEKNPLDSALWSRVFLLNRYLFAVPEKSPIDGSLFGGWAGVIVENGRVNRLWPFSIDAQNKITLIGDFEGYYGDAYKGLEEFDYFRKKYGLRDERK